MSEHLFTAKNLMDLTVVADRLLTEFGSHRVVAFEGEMGAGKTTLIKEICAAAGVVEATSSPTFSLVNEYRTKSGERIYHFDFYRIAKESEALEMGVEEYFESGSFCFIEWPEKIANLLPPDSVKVAVTVNPKFERIITLHKP